MFRRARVQGHSAQRSSTAARARGRDGAGRARGAGGGVVRRAATLQCHGVARPRVLGGAAECMSRWLTAYYTLCLLLSIRQLLL